MICRVVSVICSYDKRFFLQLHKVNKVILIIRPCQQIQPKRRDWKGVACRGKCKHGPNDPIAIL